MRRWSVAVTLLAMVGASAAGEPVPVSELPLDLCTSQQVMMQTSLEALGREVKARQSMLPAIEKIGAFASKYSDVAKPGQPIGELMNAQEAADFSRASAQTFTLNMYILAESRLQRDMKVLSRMHQLVVKHRDNPEYVPTKGSTEYYSFGYLAALTVLFKDTEHPPSKNKGECSLGLALEREADAALANFQQMFGNSREVAELTRIRRKYRAADGAPLDRSKLTTEEAAKVPTLERVVNALMSGQLPFYQDMSDLQYFADVMQMRYEAQKSDLLLQGGTADPSGYVAAEVARYKLLSPQMQQASDLWRLMDKEIPSDQYKNTMTILESIGKAPRRE